MMFALVFCLSVKADDKINIGYCDGDIATYYQGNITGLTGIDKTINMAIRIPRALYEAYYGCHITTIRWGVPETTDLPENVKVWVRGEQKGENLVSGTLSSPQVGWNEIKLDEPYLLNGDYTELWIGVEYFQPKKLSVISFIGDTWEDGCYVGKDGNFTCYATKMWGSLSIEAVVEGEIPTHNLSFLTTHAPSITKLGNPVVVTGTVKNLANTNSTNTIIRYTLNGTEKGSYTISGTLAYLQTKEFRFEVPTTSMKEEGTATIDLSLEWADGTEDEYIPDNQATVTSEIVKDFYEKRMVVEEGTGSWCGFCVRGIVGLRKMREEFPDRFIGIATHNGDEYVVSAYDTWFSSQSKGLPSCCINRDGTMYDPNYDELKSYLEKMDKDTEADIELEAAINDGVLAMTSHTRFLISGTDKDYRVVFVLVEDQCPIVQSNYYSGGAYGPMDGFEDLASKVKMNVDDVARGIYPSVVGKQGSIPATIERGVVYDYSYSTELPSIKNEDNLSVVAMVLNGTTGEVVQGVKVFLGDAAGLHTVLRPADATEVYDLSGRSVPAGTHGLVIENGRKVIR